MTKETLYKMLNMMEQNHPNLYHSVSKETVTKYVDKFAKRIEKLSEQQTKLELMRFFAMFKDSHTHLYFKEKILKLHYDVETIRGRYYFKNIAKDYPYAYAKQILKINGKPVQEIVNSFKDLIGCETKEYLNHKICVNLAKLDYLQMIGVANQNATSIRFTIKDGKNEKEFDFIIKQGEEDFVKNSLLLKTFYDCREEDGVKIIRYSFGREDPYYPLRKLYIDVGRLIEEKDTVIVDLRNNNGGNEDFFKPVKQQLFEKHCKGFVLINNGVLSAGRMALRDLKVIGFTSVGQNTGASAITYGNSKIFDCDGVLFTVSTKLFDMKFVFDCTGSIPPDVHIPHTVKDLKNMIDPELEYCKQQIAKTKKSA